VAQALPDDSRVTSHRLSSDLALGRDIPPRFYSLQLLDQMRMEAWQRLLFLECGDGWIVEEAWRRARRGYACGVDTSATLVARATALRGVPGTLEFKTWDGSRLPYPSAFFQRVISTFALERCSDPAEMCAEIRRVLQPGGDVYLLELDRLAGLNEIAKSLVAMVQTVGFHEPEEVTLREVVLDGGERAAAIMVHARATDLPRVA